MIYSFQRQVRKACCSPPPPHCCRCCPHPLSLLLPPPPPLHALLPVRPAFIRCYCFCRQRPVPVEARPPWASCPPGWRPPRCSGPTCSSRPCRPASSARTNARCAASRSRGRRTWRSTSGCTRESGPSPVRSVAPPSKSAPSSTSTTANGTAGRRVPYPMAQRADIKKGCEQTADI